MLAQFLLAQQNYIINAFGINTGLERYLIIFQSVKARSFTFERKYPALESLIQRPRFAHQYLFGKD